MAGIFGALGLNDNDRVFAATVGQQVIYETATEYIARANASLDSALALFVEETTEQFKYRYKLPGNGYLMERDRRGEYGMVKVTGYWDVAFPLRDFGADVGGDDVSMAYMTVRELDHHISGVVTRNVNTVRWHLLNAILDNTQDTYSDPLHGDLLVEPLANGDSVVYPPILAATDGATEDHYLEAGYLVSAISDTNNPLSTIREELEEHFGSGTGGENIVVFCSTDITPYLRALTGFVEVPDRFIRVGDDTDIPEGLPNVPGKVIGRHSGVWVVEWRWLPATYTLGIHMEQPGPIVRRTDPADTGLYRGGLSLVTEDERFPFQRSVWRHRFGFGVGNRLNGVVLEVANGGTYTVPTAYAS